MGSGKTCWAIEFMSKAEVSKNFLYVTPFLKETDRVVECCRREIVQPDKKDGKARDFFRLVARNEDIAITHKLLHDLDDNTLELIRQQHYTLILDEVLEVVEPVEITPSDVNILLDGETVSIDEDGLVHWLKPEYSDTEKYRHIRATAEKGHLYYIDNRFLVTVVPPKLFEVFDEVYMMTYLFEGSILYYYFQLYDIAFDRKSICRIEDEYVLVEYNNPQGIAFKSMMDIYEGTMNWNIPIGTKKMSDGAEKPIGMSKRLSQKPSCLSSTWCKGAEKSHKDVIRKNLTNYFRNVKKAKASDIMWTTFKKFAPSVHGNGFRYSERTEGTTDQSFVSYNCRATNDFASKSVLAYMLNLYMQPAIVYYFASKEISVNQELYALAELLQWIWRSRLRRGQSISIYMPSVRMRKILYKWLNAEYEFSDLQTDKEITQSVINDA